MRGILYFSALSIVIMSVSACSPKSRGPIDLSNRNPIKGAIREPSDPGVVDNWFTKSPEVDQVEGSRVDLAYSTLKLKKSDPVIVAVVDGGVDISHEDLQGHIWTNPGESGLDANGKDKSSNQIDDEKNGFVDDVHGWNFLGGYDQNHKAVDVDAETLEVTRELVKMKAKQKALNEKGLQLNPDDQKYLDKVQQIVNDGRTQAQSEIDVLQPLSDTLAKDYEVLKDVLKVALVDVTVDNLNALSGLNEPQAAAQKEMLDILAKTNSTTVVRVQTILKDDKDALAYYYNEAFNPRAAIVKDDPENLNDKNYGNNDVTGPDADHATHVSGIIAANRDNGVGINGIATDVRIMSVRAIPNGDERDKDVANAIRYAVDNGAKVINMSFGKAFSPHKLEVNQAMQYAAAHGVLLVHAAGNENSDNDTGENYPNSRQLDSGGNVTGRVSTWIEVGASTQFNDEKLPAVFSNYGKTMVDLFAPGFKIKSTTPKNTYSVFSGTSMASPVVSGVVALMLAQRTDLSPWMVRQVVIETPRTYKDLQVLLPGTDPLSPIKLLFSELSASGGVVDAVNALTKVVE